MTTNVTVTYEQLVDLDACQGGLDWFDALAVGGSITLDWTPEIQVNFIKYMGFHQWYGWAFHHSLIPSWGMCGVDMERAALYNADFAGAQLASANFHGAMLKDGNFRRACLVRANLRHANLCQSICDGADLDEACLAEADATQASFEGASFIGANLRGINLVNANLNRTNLEFANLSGARLTGASMKGAIYNSCTVWPEGFDNELATKGAYHAALHDG